METFGLSLDPNRFSVGESKVKFPYQALGLDMEKFFTVKDKPRIWSNFYKVHESKIRVAFELCQKKYNVTQDPKYKNYNYYCGVLKNLK